ncbi:hypothetical protein ACTQ5R_09810 [Ruoffia tabacinasalis]|uniref:hypothetical protein n=1 Tax=Ruoffia tabacinasalis TaxID=87458 RepID=UPI003F9BE208
MKVTDACLFCGFICDTLVSKTCIKKGTKHRFKATVSGYYEFDDKQVLVHFIRDNKAIQEYLGTYALAPDVPLIDGSKVEVFGTLIGNQTMEWDDGTSTDFPLLIIDCVVEIDDF